MTNAPVTIARRFFADVWDGDTSKEVPADLVHADYWSSEPLLDELVTDAHGDLVARLTGPGVLEQEVALYRDFYRTSGWRSRRCTRRRPWCSTRASSPCGR